MWEKNTSACAPRLSLGLPVFNGEPFLQATLDSILAQTYGDFELLISDNASTDRTPQIIREYAARDRRIKCGGTLAPARQRYQHQRAFGAAQSVDIDEAIFAIPGAGVQRLIHRHGQG